jgi:hypothetical protein
MSAEVRRNLTAERPLRPTTLMVDSYITVCISHAVRRNYSCFVDCDEPAEALIAYLEDLVATIKDPNQVGVVVDVLFQLRSYYST